MWALFSFFSITFKLSKTIAYVALVGVLTAALFLTFTALLAPISANLPASSVALASAIFPSNLNACISVVISARIARWVYDRNMKIADKISE